MRYLITSVNTSYGRVAEWHSTRDLAVANKTARHYRGRGNENIAIAKVSAKTFDTVLASLTGAA